MGAAFGFVQGEVKEPVVRVGGDCRKCPFGFEVISVSTSA